MKFSKSFQLKIVSVVVAILSIQCGGRASSLVPLFDSTFDVSGGTDDAVNALQILADGKILVGGEFKVLAGQTHQYLGRLQSDGQFDTSFVDGTDGLVNRFLKFPDGRILVGGAFTSLQDVPCRSIGMLSSAGLVQTNFNPGTNFESHEAVNALAVQPDGKILIASGTNFSATRISRLHSNGALDTSFARYGGAYFIYSILPLLNGNILVGGGFYSGDFGENSISGLFLISTNGSLITNSVAGLTNATVFSLTQLSNGNILVGGSLVIPGFPNRVALAQMKSDLTWDTNFVANNFELTAFDAGARNLLIQPDNKIVVAGQFFYVGGYFRRHIVRLDSTGQVDPCFDPGLGLGDFPGARTLARQIDGKILVGGKFDSQQWAGVANLARFQSQGECGALRTYLLRPNGPDERPVVLGTCPPGGTNLLQISRNLSDWETVEMSPFIPQTPSYLFHVIEFEESNAFFRIKKVF